MNKGFGLMGILIGIVIITGIAYGGFYYLNTTTQTTDDNSGIKNVINQTEDVKGQLEKNNENISNNLDEHVDQDTLQVLKYGFSKDKNGVYHKLTLALKGLDSTGDTKFNELDQDTFEIIAPNYAKDKNSIYYFAESRSDVGIGVERLDGVDYKTFQILENKVVNRYISSYSIDKNSVYLNGRKIDGADPNTFVVMDNYNRDKDFIYCSSRKIEGSDADTYFEYPNTTMSKDKNAVYRLCKKIEGVDSASFILFINDAERGKWASYFAKDKNSIYILYTDHWEFGPIMEFSKTENINVDHDTFIGLNSNFAKDKNYVYRNMYDGTIEIIEKADPNTFIGLDNGLGKDKNNLYDSTR